MKNRLKLLCNKNEQAHIVILSVSNRIIITYFNYLFCSLIFAKFIIRLEIEIFPAVFYTKHINSYCISYYAAEC